MTTRRGRLIDWTIMGIWILAELIVLGLLAFRLPPVEVDGFSAYELLATVNVTSFGDVVAACEQAGRDPLYPLLLYGVLRLLPAGAGQHGAAILHLGLGAVLLALYAVLARRLIPGEGRVLPPLLFGLSASFVSALTMATPTLLAMTLAAALALFYHVHLQRPIRTLSGAALCLLVLPGILTDYGFFFLALAFALPYGGVSLLRRRTSDGVTAPVLTLLMGLVALVVNPAYIDRTVALFTPGRFLAVSYIDRVHYLLQGLTFRLYGGKIPAAIIGVLLLLAVIAAAAVDAMRPKKEDAAAPDAGDPSRAAYQRRIARRTALPRKVTVTRAQVYSLLLVAACVLHLLLLPLYEATGASFQTLDPFWHLLLLGALHYAAPRLCRKPHAYDLTAIAVCVILAALTYATLVWRVPFP